MRKVPEISVILPFFNAEKTLDRAIKSIIGQTFENFELILVNNNSSDRSHEIAREWSKRDNRILLKEENQQGVVRATGKGLSVCRGSYVSRMDADDVALEEKLEIQKSFLDTNQSTGAVACMVEHVPAYNLPGGIERFVQWNNSIASAEEISLNRFIELPLVNPTLMWRKEISDLHGLYLEGNFPEDYEMILRWLDAGVRIEKIDRILLKWYDSPSRLTRTDHRYRDRAFFEIKSVYLSKWLEKYNPYHPLVSVWGASRISRRRARILEDQGIRIEYYIDTKKTRQLEKDILFYRDLPEAREMFILSYIRQYDNRDRIRKFLNKKGYCEGKNYLMIS